MKRRDFVTLLGAAVIALSLAAHAQQPAVPRVGYVWSGVRGTDVLPDRIPSGTCGPGYVVGRNPRLPKNATAEGKPVTRSCADR